MLNQVILDGVVEAAAIIDDTLHIELSTETVSVIVWGDKDVIVHEGDRVLVIGKLAGYDTHIIEADRIEQWRI